MLTTNGAVIRCRPALTPNALLVITGWLHSCFRAGDSSPTGKRTNPAKACVSLLKTRTCFAIASLCFVLFDAFALVNNEETPHLHYRSQHRQVYEKPSAPASSHPWELFQSNYKWIKLCKVSPLSVWYGIFANFFSYCRQIDLWPKCLLIMRPFFVFRCGIAFVLLSPSLAKAQLSLPQASPLAKVTQVVGLTEISVTYHAPGVKGRAIWGSLIPYGQVWRSGANQSTRIKFEDDVLIGGQRVPAGQYAFYTLPVDSANAFVILNRDTARWGTEGYDPQADLFRVPVGISAAPFTETLQYSFANVQPTASTLLLSWERRRINIPIQVEVLPKAVANIRKAVAQAKPDDWLLLTQAAEYLVKNDVEHVFALELLNRSIAIQQNYYNTWVKARLLAQKDEYRTAIQLTRTAMELGEKVSKTPMPFVAPTAYTALEPDMRLAVAQWKTRQQR